MEPWPGWRSKEAFERAVGEAVGESQDGTGAGDHDKPYYYDHPTARSHAPFTALQFVKLLILRGRMRDDPFNGDTHSTERKK